MNIISHRGLWDNNTPKNSIKSIENSLINGFGTETDLRDFNGNVIISHDMPCSKNKIFYFDEFLEIYKQINSELPIALNVKSDGLTIKIKEALEKHQINNYFLFDMSVPDQLQYIKNNLNVYSRLSEFEKKPLFLDLIKGIWLDSFESKWFNKKTICKYLSLGKNVCIVSPELHNRPYIELWKYLKQQNLYKFKGLTLCTDIPLDAKTFFYEK